MRLLVIILSLSIIVSCTGDETTLEETVYNLPYAKAYLEFSDGLIIDEVSTDSCSWDLVGANIITTDSILFRPTVTYPSPELNDFIRFHLVFNGYDCPSGSSEEDYEVFWDNINKNDHSLINQEPYKINFYIEYKKDPDNWNNSRYINSHNGNFVGALGFPYGIDEGNMRLTNVKFRDTDYHLACSRPPYGNIRFQADVNGDLFNRDYSDTITVAGSIDLLLLTNMPE